MKIGNIIMAVFFIVLGSVFFISSLGFGVGSSGDVGSGFFPKIISGSIVVLSISIIIQEIHKNSKEKLIDKYVIRSFIIVIITLLYIVLMNIIGFLIATPIFIAVTLFMVNERELLKVVLISVALTVLIYICFKIGLNVRLPETFFGY